MQASPPRPHVLPARPTAFAVPGILLISCAVLLNPANVGTLVAEDGDIDQTWVVGLLVAFEMVAGLAGAVVLWRGRPRQWSKARLVVSLVLAVGTATGLHGLHMRSRTAPWEAAGLPMTERLALLAARGAKVYHHGAEPEELRARAAQMEAEGKTQRALTTRRELADSLLRRGEFTEAAAVLEETLVRLRDVESSKRIGFEKDVRNTLVAAYLRRAEIENCAADHNQDSCLLPIRGGGVHRQQEASRHVIELLLPMLEEDPDDLLSRWILNIAYMTVDEYPAGVPVDQLIAPDVFASEAAFPRLFDVAPGLGLDVPHLAGGSALEDFDGDGDLDLMASGMGRDDQLHYFENRGDGTFADRTAEAGLDGLVGGLNLGQTDYDNDGLRDVMVFRGAWKGPTGGLPNSLLHNDGGGEFTDVTEEAGLLEVAATSTAVWADYDDDGLLDVFVANESRDWHPQSSHLYRNQGDGTFRDEIRASGIATHGFVKGAAWGDYDNDGDSDLYLSRRYSENALFRNDGGGDFTDVTKEAGLDGYFQSFPVWFFDYDNDGGLDLFVAAFSGSFLDEEEGGLVDIPAVRLGLETGRDGYPRLYHNEGDGTFTEVAGPMGLRRVILVMGANFGDVDNDGWLDLYLGTGKPDYRGLMANRLFKNDGGRAFLDVTTAAGMGHLQKGHGISFGDVDDDGDQDVYAVLGGAYPGDWFPNALFENPGHGNHWITLRLEGVQSNRPGIGVRIKIVVETAEGTREIHRTVGSGGSFGASSLQQEIGLGAAKRIRTLELFWPTSETIQSFPDVAMDRIYAVREDAAAPVDLEIAPTPLRPGEASHAGHSGH